MGVEQRNMGTIVSMRRERKERQYQKEGWEHWQDEDVIKEE